jgi:hypothetical protein
MSMPVAIRCNECFSISETMPNDAGVKSVSPARVDSYS